MGQKSIKGETKDCFLFDSWFDSKKAAESTMEVGAKLIGMVKTNTKGFLKETIEKLTKDWPGGSYLVLRSKPMVPGGQPLFTAENKFYITRGQSAGQISTLVNFSGYLDK